MPNIESIVRQINREFVPHFEEKLRSYLGQQEKEWLIEQIVRLTLDAHSLEEMDRKHFKEEENSRRAERVLRVTALDIDRRKLAEFLAQYKGQDRAGLLRGGPPEQKRPRQRRRTYRRRSAIRPRQRIAGSCQGHVVRALIWGSIHQDNV